MSDSRRVGNSDLIDIAVQLHATTRKAVLVSDDGDRKKAVWVPLSQCEMEPGEYGAATLTMPEWLAIEKGFI